MFRRLAIFKETQCFPPQKVGIVHRPGAYLFRDIRSRIRAYCGYQVQNNLLRNQHPEIHPVIVPLLYMYRYFVILKCLLFQLSASPRTSGNLIEINVQYISK